jgi:ATP-dependent DNA helicase RecG
LEEKVVKIEHIESKILEFKEKMKDYSRLVETITAFSNTQGGTIVIGIRDSDREIIGLSDADIIKYHQEIPQVAADAISPQIAVDLYEQNMGGKTCLTIRVFPGPQKPYFIKKTGYPAGIFLRFGSHNRRADPYAVEEFSRSKTGVRFEQSPCPRISYADLSSDLLAIIFKECNETILIGAGLGVTEVSGRTIPNVAGALLFYPTHHEIVPESIITVAHYAGADKQNLIRSDSFSGGLYSALEASYTYLIQRLGKTYELSGLAKKPTEYDVPIEAVREALVNAVAHRAYDYEAPIRIMVYSDRVEFLNPGNFYAPIHPENLKEGLSRYRNPLIADALRKTGHMEKQGIGISLIIDSCVDAGLKEPQFVELENHVKVILYLSKTQNFSRIENHGNLEDLKAKFRSEETLSSLELAQYLGKSQTMAKKILQKMQSDKVVEKIGQGPATRYRLLE